MYKEVSRTTFASLFLFSLNNEKNSRTLYTIDYQQFAERTNRYNGQSSQQKNQPLEFVTVGIKNTSWGTTTNNRGDFTLNATTPGKS